MNKEKSSPTPPIKNYKAKYPIHPYFTSHGSEETLRRMKGVRERIAERERQLNADREADKS